MKNIVLLLFTGLAAMGCRKSLNLSGSVMLKGAKPAVGKHCESSAIVNALHYQGYDIDETLLTGAGGVIAFLYQKTDFPFIGGRSHDMREVAFDNLGISWQLRRPGADTGEWEKIFELLRSGYPVVLRVDMRYLPYLWGGKYGNAYTSFGWHVITLFGMDAEKGIAWVTDTELSGLNEIKLKDLEKARSSRTKVFPPGNEYYWVEKKPAGYTFDWHAVTANSLKQVVANMGWEESGTGDDKTNLAGLEGLSRLSLEMINIETSVKSYLLQPVFDFFYGSIETNGTGGALFRNFYHDFLVRAAEKLQDSRLFTAAEYATDCVQGWERLADQYKKIATAIKGIKSKTERARLYQEAAIAAQDVYQKEKEFYNYLKGIIQEGGI